MHTYAEPTTIRNTTRHRVGALALVFAVTSLVLTGCSDSQTTAPSDGQAADSVAQILTVELERLEARRSNADAEWETAEKDWALYQQGWPTYQATYPEANEQLLRCAPLRFVGEAKIIGPEGGTIDMGVHQLVVPQGALSEDVVITGELTTGPLVAVDLLPHGLTFQKPVLLRMAYNHCESLQASLQEEDGEGEGDGAEGDGAEGDGAAGDGSGEAGDGTGDGTGDGGTGVPAPQPHGIVHVDMDESILEQLPSTDDDTNAAVEAWLSHFSRYAVMY
jgi:hypothetical protein